MRCWEMPRSDACKVFGFPELKRARDEIADRCRIEIASSSGIRFWSPWKEASFSEMKVFSYRLSIEDPKL